MTLTLGDGITGHVAISESTSKNSVPPLLLPLRTSPERTQGSSTINLMTSSKDQSSGVKSDALRPETEETTCVVIIGGG